MEKVRDRLRRSTAALEAAGIPYAVIGGNAVAAWVSKVDPGGRAIRSTSIFMVNRSDLDAVKTALSKAGFVYYDLIGRRICSSMAPMAGRAMPFIYCLREKKCKPEYSELRHRRLGSYRASTKRTSCSHWNRSW